MCRLQKYPVTVLFKNLQINFMLIELLATLKNKRFPNFYSICQRKPILGIDDNSEQPEKEKLPRNIRYAMCGALSLTSLSEFEHDGIKKIARPVG